MNILFFVLHECFQHFAYSYTYVVHRVPEINYEITVTAIITMVITFLFILREFWQLGKLKKRS